MGFPNQNTARFKTGVRHRFITGYGVLLELERVLPEHYDASQFGDPNDRGLALTGAVCEVLGARTQAPKVGAKVTIHLRPTDLRIVVYQDLVLTNVGARVLLEGVHSEDGQRFEARWAHGAGKNRQVRGLEIVGAPHVSFENPVAGVGPKKGWFYLNLDGSPTVYESRASDGKNTTNEIAYDEAVRRLGLVIEKQLKFKVSQRVLEPSAAVQVRDQEELEYALNVFRQAGFTSSAVRTYVPGTTHDDQVDVQILSWPKDVPADEKTSGITYEMPVLAETRKFAALRDGEAPAHMEVIPGYVMSLVGNADPTKSTKHRFAQGILRGLSDGQKAMYATQAYGPGIALSSVGEDGTVAGLVRLALRTEGLQYRQLLNIPTPNFVDADKVEIAPKRGLVDPSVTAGARQRAAEHDQPTSTY